MGKDKGFTLIELILVMGIFIVVILAITSTFNNILGRASQQAKSATSQIEGIVGLEMLRTDVAHSGFALPWAFQGGIPPGYKEINDGAFPAGVAITPANFNALRDIPPNLPRAVAGSVTTGGSHYLVLKSALLALNSPSVGRWGFVTYSTNSAGNNLSHIRRINDPASDVQAGQDRLISIISSFSTAGVETKSLLVNAGGAFSYTVTSPSYMPADNAFKPADPVQSVFAYAISNVDIRMPYNRADYYIDFAAVKPTSCNPGTGVLTKAVADQAGGYGPVTYPLLNCVGDLQVVLALDPNNDGNMSYYPPDSPVVTGLSAEDLRTQLKNIRVYILAQDGIKDRNFSYPGTSILVGETGIGGKTWTQAALADASAFGAEWMRYRWKVYGIVVSTKNTQQ